MIVGVGGGYCAGKNSACSFFANQGYTIVDVDKIGHEVLHQQRNKVIAHFGATVTTNGDIDRRKLAKIIFSSPQERLYLESIVHPIMRSKVIDICAHTTNIVINAALLFYMHLDSLCDLVLWITAPWYRRCIRAARRDSLSLYQIWRRMYSQNLNVHILENNAEIYRVRNNRSIETLHGTIQHLLMEYQEKQSEDRAKIELKQR